jgi:NAD(P)-dependent dehydrogenase (short-subunit alcohol dehydrogenase family)
MGDGEARQTTKGRVMRVSGAAAIVTGGGSGLGRATAEALAAKGARVAVFDVNPAAAEEAAKAIGGLAVVCDVGDDASATAAVAKSEEAHGPARILVACAGIGTPTRVVTRDGAPAPLADFERVIRVNLVGVFNMIRLAAASMGKLEPVDGERGVIISTASIAAFEGQSGQAAYSASKGGVVSMTLPIARELARVAVRVNTIAPGIFMTPMLAGLRQEVQDSLGASVPFPARVGAPSEFAALAVHIVENGYINGETIRIDGALRMPAR